MVVFILSLIAVLAFVGIALALSRLELFFFGWKQKSNPPTAPAPTPSGEDADNDLFAKQGDFEPLEAERILRRFEEEKIRFQIDPEDQWHWSVRGGPQRNCKIGIFVHRDDEKKASRVISEGCKI